MDFSRGDTRGTTANDYDKRRPRKSFGEKEALSDDHITSDDDDDEDDDEGSETSDVDIVGDGKSYIL